MLVKVLIKIYIGIIAFVSEILKWGLSGRVPWFETGAAPRR